MASVMLNHHPLYRAKLLDPPRNRSFRREALRASFPFGYSPYTGFFRVNVSGLLQPFRSLDLSMVWRS